jgi:hypothetical protein
MYVVGLVGQIPCQNLFAFSFWWKISSTTKYLIFGGGGVRDP